MGIEKMKKVCSVPNCTRVTEGHKMCDFHLKAAQKRKKKFRAKSKKEGQCRASDCTNMAEKGKSRCASCRKKYLEYERRPEVRAKRREKQRLLKEEVFSKYGGSCVCCGESDFEILTIDHVEGYDGTGPRRGDHLYQWLKANNYPDGFRVLCVNCNTSLAHHGYCPHSSLKQIIRPKNNSKKAIYQKQYHQKNRLLVFREYGGAVCKYCGENHIEFLTIDHINDDGAEHRKKDSTAYNIYRWLIQHDFPEGFQVLCMNCNFAKRYSKNKDM